MQAEAVKATQRRTVWNVLRRNLSLTAGCLILLCVVFTALFPGLIASQSPTDQNLTAMLAAPSAEHIWGTDELGRDIFARVIWGARYDLVIGLAAVIIGEVIFSRVRGNFAFKLFSAALGAIIYYIVLQVVLWLGLNSNDLKLFSALVVALFLAIPYLKGKYFNKPAKKGGAPRA